MPKPKAQAKTPASKIMREIAPPPEAAPPATPAPPSDRELVAAMRASVSQTQKVLATYQAFQDVMGA